MAERRIDVKLIDGTATKSSVPHVGAVGGRGAINLATLRCDLAEIFQVLRSLRRVSHAAMSFAGSGASRQSAVDWRSDVAMSDSQRSLGTFLNLRLFFGFIPGS